jgi:hypothetical protein
MVRPFSWELLELLKPQTTDRKARKYLDQIRRNAGPYTDPDATAPEFLAQFETFKVL